MEEAAQAAGWQRELLGQAHLPETQQYGISSFVYRAPRPFHPLRLWTAVLEPAAASPAPSRPPPSGATVVCSGSQGGQGAHVACSGLGDGEPAGVACSGSRDDQVASVGSSGSRGGQVAAAPRGTLPPVLRSKGFFSLAAQPDLVWEWSTVGQDKRFRPYGRWTPPGPSPGGSSGTHTGVATSVTAEDAATPAEPLELQKRRRQGEAAAGEGEEGDGGGLHPQLGGEFFEQRLVFIGANLEQVSLPAVCFNIFLGGGRGRIERGDGGVVFERQPSGMWEHCKTRQVMGTRAHSTSCTACCVAGDSGEPGRGGPVRPPPPLSPWPLSAPRLMPEESRIPALLTHSWPPPCGM